MDNELTSAPPGRSPLGRRAALGAGLGAAVSVVGGFGAARAQTVPASTPADTVASAETTPADGSAPAPTTTVPPQRPVGDDAALLAHLQSLEQAARHLYDGAVASGSVSGATAAVFAVLRDAHSAHAQAFNAVLGRASSLTPSTAFDGLATAFAGSDAAKAAYELENQLVATHVEAIGRLQGTDGANLVASIATVDARYGTVLADVAGSTDLDELLVAKAADAVSVEG